MSSTNHSYSRVNRPLSEAEVYYSRLSSFYDLLALSEKKFIRQGLSLLAAQEGESILEIGSGTGYAQIILARKIGKGICVGLDLSKGMCQIAQRNLNQKGLTSQGNIIRSDTLPIPFETGIFDAVFTSFTLELFDSPQIPLMLSECRRVLKPDGRIVVVSLSRDVALPWGGRLYEWLHDQFPKVLDCRPIPARLLLEKAGFEIIRDQLSLMWGLPVITIRANK